MQPAFGMMLVWMLFAGTHVGLATRRIRAALVARVGEAGFVVLFSGVAVAIFTVLVRYYAGQRFAGTGGLALGDVPLLRPLLMATSYVGITLALAGVLVFPSSPMAMFVRGTPAPHGLARITRHPFLIGTALMASAHTLLAHRLVGAVFFAGLALLALVGAWHQDRKLLALRGREYARYLAGTSALPFAAVLAGRQRLVWRELPIGALVTALVLALALRAVHDSIFAAGGAWVIAVTVGSAALLGLASWRRAERLGARGHLAPDPGGRAA